MPAWLAVSDDVNDKLKESSRGATSSRSHHRLQHALIVGEVALALVLLSGAGATIRSLQRFVHLDPGWRVDGLLTAQLNLASYGEPEKRPLFFEELERRLAALPGVQSAGISSSSPVWSNGGGRYLAIEGRPAPAPGEAPLAACASVSPAYFATLGIRIRQGRTFSSADTSNRPAVVVINESLARQFWPGENPIGKRVGGTDPAKPDWAEVVGVVNDAGNPTNPFKPDTRLQLYEPLAQKPEWGFTIVMRTTAAPASIAPGLRRTVAELDADLPVYWIQSVRQIIARGMAGSYHLAGLLGVSGILGLVLAAVGIYGVTSYSMAQRTGELGIRMALGAQKFDMLWLVLRQGLRLGLFGVVLGFGGSFAMMRILGALTPSDSPVRDPVTMAGVPVSGWVVAVIAAVVLLAVALLACYFPARRATRINPIEALRYE
jgi:predicted permease